MSPLRRWSCVGLLGLALACGGNEGSSGDPELAGSLGEDRIIGGAAFTGVPAVGSLIRSGASHCTATLIDAKRIVTAAHCFYGLATPSAYKFAIGPNAKSPEKTYGIASIRVHSGFNVSTVVDDIAVATLTTTATETPVKVLDNLDSSWVGASLTFVGYGVDNGQRQSGNGVKRSVIMPISEVGATQFAYETAGKNTCNGDSGGPAFFIDQAGNYLLAGITSYGDTYCTQYGVDTLVPAYSGWLSVSTYAPNQATNTPPADPCNGETFEGRCSGTTVTWCENQQVYQVDCAKRAKVCGFSESDGYTGCIAKPAPVDPCKGETYRGRCDGNTVVWCESNAVQQIDCAEHNGVCGYDAGRAISNCAY